MSRESTAVHTSWRGHVGEQRLLMACVRGTIGRGGACRGQESAASRRERKARAKGEGIADIP